jgi:hypothetical protein
LRFGEVAGIDVCKESLILINFTHDELSATVELGGGNSSNVFVSKLGDECGVECSYCLVWWDSGLLCNCAVAAFHRASLHATYGKSWSIYDERFVCIQRRFSTWFHQCQVPLLTIPFDCGVIDVSADSVLHWATRPPKPGRKKDAKHVDRVKPTSLRVYRCIGCGEDGHSLPRCEDPDLDRVCLALAHRAGLFNLYSGIIKAPIVSHQAKRHMIDEHLGLEGALHAVGDSVWGDFDDDLIDTNQASDFSDVSAEFGQLIHFPSQREEVEGEFNILGGEINLDVELTNSRLLDEGTKQSIALDLLTNASLHRLFALAQTFGLVENVLILRDGNCFFDAVRDQLSILRPNVVIPTHIEV